MQLTQKPWVDNKSPALFLKKPLCIGDLLHVHKYSLKDLYAWFYSLRNYGPIFFLYEREQEGVNLNKDIWICFVLPGAWVLYFSWEGETMICTINQHEVELKKRTHFFIFLEKNLQLAIDKPFTECLELFS